MTLDAKLRSTLLRCDELLDSHGARVALETLGEELMEIRNGCSPVEWRRAISLAGVYALVPRLLEDPFMADALRKPRGYAGDARTLDYVYGHRLPDRAVSTL